MAVATSNDDSPLANLPPSNFHEFAAAGTKLFYEFTPLGRLPGLVGDELRLSTIVGVVHTGERADKVFAVRITIADVQGQIEGTCRLDYTELDGLIALIDSLFDYQGETDDGLTVALITFETREGFILEVDRLANIRIGNSRTVVHNETGLQRFAQMLLACQAHLDQYRQEDG